MPRSAASRRSHRRSRLQRLKKANARLSAHIRHEDEFVRFHVSRLLHGTVAEDPDRRWTASELFDRVSEVRTLIQDFEPSVDPGIQYLILLSVKAQNIDISFQSSPTAFIPQPYRQADLWNAAPWEFRKTWSVPGCAFNVVGSIA